MAIRKADVIAYQLALTAPETVAFAEGGETLLTPARWVPELTSAAQVSLEGSWQVVYWPFPAPEAVLVAPAGGDVMWDDIAQPGKVIYYDPEQSPDSIPNWNRVKQSHIDPDDGAIIRRCVAIPDAWCGQRVLLRFEGIYPAGKIYWDGELIAEQWSGLTPLEVDVTDRAVPGQTHTVAIRLYRRHDAIQLDMPRHALDFVGLSRTAFLHAVEPLHVADLRIQADLADDYATGTVRGEIALRNASDQEATALLLLTLVDAAGKDVAAKALAATVAAGATTTLTAEMPAGQVLTWNAEEPHLYFLSVRLSAYGQEEQEIIERVGFRRFEIAGGRPRLNGNLVKFRGVNHLTFHPDYGLYTPEPWLRENLLLMKKANVNAIRTHFTGPRELTELCDELGLYLLQELPIDWGTDYVQEPSLFGPMLHRMEAGARRDRNHPALMVWSVGNENMPALEERLEAFNAHLRLCGQMVKAVDPTRPTMYPPPGPANKIAGIFEARLGDIADIHYSFNLVREFNDTGVVTNPRTWEPTFETHTRGQLQDMGWSGVWFSSEYGINNLHADLLHAPYSSILADVMEDPLSGRNSQQVFIDRLNREWGYMRDDPTCLGGAYFCWLAAGAGDPWGWVRWGEDADWSIVTGDLQPKSFFWAMRAIFAPVRIPDRVVWHPGDTAITVTVHNDFNSLDLADCTLRTQMGGGPPYMGMLRDWRDVPMVGAPGTAAEVTIPLWNKGSLSTLERNAPVIVRCTILDPTGYRVIMTDILVIPEAAQAAPEAAMPIGPDAE